MADEQNNKTSTIDDLVKELSKNNSNPSFSDKPTMNQNSPSRSAGPPPNLPGIKIGDKPFNTAQNKPPMPLSYPVSPAKPFIPHLASTMPPAPVSGFKPSVSVQPQPQPIQPSQARPEPPHLPQPLGPSFQEYKSSIRTMSEDISSIKSGQKPSGVDISREVVPELPKMTPGISKSTVTPPSKGPVPSSIGLGKAEKTSLLPFTPVPKGLETPKPLGIQPSIIIPGEKRNAPGFLNSTFYMLIAGILVVGGFIYWFFFLRVSGPEITVSPTPSPTLTVTPSVKSLSEIFSVSGGAPVNFEVSLADNMSDDFKTFIDTLTVSRNEFARINLVEDAEGTLVPISFLDMFDNALVIYPASLKDNMIDFAVLAYGQSEAFNVDGTLNLSVQDLKKTVFVTKVEDKITLEALMKEWEHTIADDLAGFLFISNTTQKASANFLDNAYRGVVIRYNNFPFPDFTVDYAVVEAAGQNYLVIAGSREAMYSAIDVLLEQ